MFKKLTHVFLASALALASFAPLAPQTALADDVIRSTPSINAPNAPPTFGPMPLLDGGGELNFRLLAFREAVDSVAGIVGPDRVIDLTGAATGTPTEIIQDHVIDSGMPITDVVASEIIATVTDTPPDTVIDMVQDSGDLIDVCFDLGLPLELFLQRLNCFTKTCNLEAGIAVGRIQPNLDVFLRLDRTVTNFDNRFDLLATRFGSQTANQALFRLLSIETGVPVVQIQNLQSNVGSDVTLGRFAVSLLIASSVNAVVTTDISITEISFNNPSNLNNLLQINNIPPQLVIGRAQFLQRACGIELR